MLSIILFAIIGSVIDPGWVYWVFFGLYCAWTFAKWISDAEVEHLEDGDENESC